MYTLIYRYTSRIYSVRMYCVLFCNCLNLQYRYSLSLFIMTLQYFQHFIKLDRSLFIRWIPRCAKAFLNYRACWQHLLPQKDNDSTELIRTFFSCVAALMSIQLRSMVINSLNDFVDFLKIHQASRLLKCWHCGHCTLHLLIQIVMSNCYLDQGYMFMTFLFTGREQLWRWIRWAEVRHEVSDGDQIDRGRTQNHFWASVPWNQRCHPSVLSKRHQRFGIPTKSKANVENDRNSRCFASYISFIPFCFFFVFHLSFLIDGDFSWRCTFLLKKLYNPFHDIEIRLKLQRPTIFLHFNKFPVNISLINKLEI